MMNNVRSFVTILGLAACVAFSGIATAKTRVYLVADQSNTVGAGDYTEGQFNASEMDTMNQVDVYFSRDGVVYDWETLAPGLGSDWRPTWNGGMPCFGPEITFGVGMQNANPDDKIVLVKFAVDGTSMDGFWKPSANYYFPRLVNGAIDAVTSLNGGDVGGDTGGVRSVGEEIEYSGMIWMQGESDAMSLGAANAYEQNMTDFVTGIRTELGVSDMPFVIGRINVANHPDFTYRDIVRQAQADVANDMDNVSMIDTDDLPFADNGVHYNYDGQDILGYRFADAMIALPEPSCLAMLGLGLISLVRRR